MYPPRNTSIFTGLEQVRRAESRIKEFVRETFVEPAPQLSHGEGGVFLKLENQQVTGSFKVRGALSKLLAMDDSERQKGVVAASAGNHGLGIALAASQLGIKATVVVPTSVDASKRAALESFGIELVVDGADFDECEDIAMARAKSENRVFVSPYNDPDVVAGQGTIGAELLRQLPHVDVVFVAVGGGGLISGIAGYLKAVKPEIKIVAVSPSNSPAMFDELANTPYEFRLLTTTLSDSTAGSIQHNSITIDLCRALVDQWILVEEAEIASAMRYLFFEHRLVVEGAGALTVAAYRKESERYQDLNTALVVCGGNIDMQKFTKIVTEARPSGS